MADNTIKFNETYRNFLKNNQKEVGRFVPLIVGRDDESTVSVKEIMIRCADNQKALFTHYQEIARVDSINFSKLDDSLRMLDDTIAVSLATSAKFIGGK